MASKKLKRKKKVAKAKAASRKKSSRRKKPTRAGGQSAGSKARIHQGVALGVGQSGDLQGLSSVEDVDSESVEELVEEGQAFEAGIVSGVENAPDADESEVRTKEVPEDDVPSEYREAED
jgi:hypothetical protein